MSGSLVLINGVPYAPEDAKVSVFDRGLLYGDSVFETLGTYEGKPFAIVEHVRRLRKSAELVFIDLELSDGELIAEISDAVRRAGNAESYVRITVTRGSGDMGLDPALALEPQRIIIVTPLHRPEIRAYESGVTAITYKTQRTTDETLASGAKVGNYLVAVLAMREAKPRRANEALIIDKSNRVIEGATSNLFYVKGDVLYTPPESAGILLGITRSVVLEAAKREGLELLFECPTVDELRSASELFITSSIRQLLAITHLDGVPIGKAKPGPVYRRLRERFTEVVHDTMRRDGQI